MELRHLRYFLALAERLSFTQAAVQLHVTQSTLSHQISQLESELGQQLFDRSARRVTLTAAGELFLPQAAKALAEIDVGIALIGAPEKGFEGTLSLGTTMTLNMGLVPKCLALFSRAHPSMRLMVEENKADGLITDMHAGRLDLILAYRPFELGGLLFEPLYSEEMVVAVNQKHPFAKRKRLRMIELHGRDLALPARKFTTACRSTTRFVRPVRSRRSWWRHLPSRGCLHWCSKRPWRPSFRAVPWQIIWAWSPFPSRDRHSSGRRVCSGPMARCARR